MNKKTLAIILSIALAIGAFAGLSLFSANAVTYVGDGNELISNGNAAELFGIAGTNSKISTTGATGSVSIIDDSDAAEGKTSNGKVVKVTPRGDTAKGNRGSINVTSMLNAQGEGKYIASVWVKVTEATAAVKIGFGFGVGGTIEDRKQFTVQPNTWTKLAVSPVSKRPKFTIVEVTSCITSSFVQVLG